MKAQYPHEFELVLITRDTEEADMTAYAKEMNMPWPQLKLSKAEQFREEVTIGGKGIPGVVLTDLHGKVLESTYHNGEYVGPEIALLKMKELLK
jgi:acyl CoA:acetate/3-ketoacid CoA transferase alpha subunit